MYDQQGAWVELPRTRKGNFSTDYDPRYCDMLIAHMSTGKSFYSFGAICGVSKAALARWCDRHPEFKEAKEIGKLKALDKLEEAGLQGMHEGKSFNAMVWSFIMRSRFREEGYQDRESSSEQINIQNNVQLSTADLAKLIQVARGETQPLPPAQLIAEVVPSHGQENQPAASCAPAPADPASPAPTRTADQ
jgi:hypothetical protein